MIYAVVRAVRTNGIPAQTTFVNKDVQGRLIANGHEVTLDDVIVRISVALKGAVDSYVGILVTYNSDEKPAYYDIDGNPSAPFEFV